MNKIFFLLIASLVFTSCKKTTQSPTNNPVTIDYEFSAQHTDTYSVNYINGSGNTISENTTGTKWSKVFKVNNLSNFKTATLAIGSTTTGSGSGTISIAVNGTVKASNNFILNSTTVVANVYYVLP